MNELDIHLNKLKEVGIYNKRNGHTKDITLTLENRQIQINRPRLRNEDNFDSIFIPKRTRIIKDLTDIDFKNMSTLIIETGKISEKGVTANELRIPQSLSSMMNEFLNVSINFFISFQDYRIDVVP